jgi:hypothetical protein
MTEDDNKGIPELQDDQDVAHDEGMDDQEWKDDADDDTDDDESSVSER